MSDKFEQEEAAMNEMPVITYQAGEKHVGNGIYSMIACFRRMGVHVPYTFEAHSENEYLETVGEPFPCDGSCKLHRDNREDFAKQRHDSSHSVQRIIDAAMSFKA
jgi:hypothetical protein